MEKKNLNAIGAALGLALGFCTKGHIAVFTPAVGILFYILYKGDWKSFYHPQLLLLLVAFCVFISPVVYCYYLQFDMHPEKVIRGKSARSGVDFILWKQNFERFQGDSFGADAKNDYLFFFHSFLWAFAPWSVLAFIAFFDRARRFLSRKYEWLTITTIAVMALMITFSGFKLPHYLNIIFPVAAILCASYLLEQSQRRKSVKSLLLTQIIICALCLVVAGVVNVWAFPVTNAFVIAGFVVLLAGVVFLLLGFTIPMQKLVGTSVLTSILLFFLLNANFYPRLLHYQAGNEMAFDVSRKANAKNIYFWPEVYSHSFNFYTAELRKEFTDSTMQQPSPIWIMTDSERLEQMKQKNLPIIESYEKDDYGITTMQLPFINPATRKGELTKLILVRIK
jgi:4-amino-4-deoxy-L-arabinose transferase-like glycosyltransferase